MDVDCYLACINSGTPEAQELAWAVADCAIANGCTDEYCVMSYCAAEVEACLQGVPPECDPPCAADEVCEQGVCVPVSQGLSCNGIIDCGLACDDMDIACYQACIDQGTSEAQEYAWALANCAIAHGCSDVDCVLGNCATEVEACLQN
jgi:hypothetical protein